MIFKFKSLNNIIKLHMLQIIGISSYTYATWCQLLHRMHPRISFTSCYLVFFCRFIIFACLAFPAAQRGLGSFTSGEKLSVHRCTTALGVTIKMFGLIVFFAVMKTCIRKKIVKTICNAHKVNAQTSSRSTLFCVVVALRSSTAS